jgi:hypothetical protein
MTNQIQQEIKKVIDNYLQAIKTGNVSLFRQIFHPQALVIYPGLPGESAAVTSVESFANHVAESISEHGKVEEIPRNIRFENYRNIGAVKLDFELTIGDSIYEGTDFFSLVKAQGQWLITQKVYDMVPEGS